MHPGGFRVGVIHDWKSHWYTEKEFKQFLAEDELIRKHIMRKLAHAGLSRILIRKDQNNVTIDIHTARPGIVIGKSGSEVDALRKEIHAMTKKNVQVNIIEVKRPELDAVLVAQSIAEQLENRVSFRRAMKRALTSAMRSGAAGMRVRCGGRLGGAEMARNEHYSEGRVPLHTLRADIDYGFREARTTFGRIGVKVWINKGEDPARGLPGGRGQGTPRTRRGAPRRSRTRRGAAVRAVTARPPAAAAWSGRTRARSRSPRSWSRRPRRSPGRPRRTRSRWSRRGPGSPRPSVGPQGPDGTSGSGSRRKPAPEKPPSPPPSRAER